MIIVSQDKEKIINFDNIKEIRQIHEDYNDVEIEALINDNYTVLGRYKTTERAKEVLQNITKTYFEENCEFENGIYHLQKIYEMPED